MSYVAKAIITYYPNGQVESETRYDDKDREIWYDSWYDSGQKWEEIRYDKGIIEFYITRYPNGQCKHAYKYDDKGDLISYKKYDEKGNLMHI
jgi:antitoxin component YwqK of YwqJK toxin-antitoxin module